MIEETIRKVIPFTKGYVLSVTMSKLKTVIDISIRKTFERSAEFSGHPEKSVEVFSTLEVLHKIRALLEDFQNENNEHFKGK